MKTTLERLREIVAEEVTKEVTGPEEVSMQLPVQESIKPMREWVEIEIIDD
jgi:hypothetical protein